MLALPKQSFSVFTNTAHPGRGRGCTALCHEKTKAGKRQWQTGSAEKSTTKRRRQPETELRQPSCAAAEQRWATSWTTSRRVVNNVSCDDDVIERTLQMHRTCIVQLPCDQRWKLCDGLQINCILYHQRFLYTIFLTNLWWTPYDLTLRLLIEFD